MFRWTHAAGRSAHARAAAGRRSREFDFEKLPTVAEEPLKAELRAFLDCVRARQNAGVDGAAGRRALELADRVMAGIHEHGEARPTR